MIVWDVIWCVMVATNLRLRSRTPWPLVVFMVALRLGSAALWWMKRPLPSLWMQLSSDFMWIALYWGSGGPGKRLWGKLRAQALTAVNQASFRRQSKEAFHAYPVNTQ